MQRCALGRHRNGNPFKWRQIRLQREILRLPVALERRAEAAVLARAKVREVERVAETGKEPSMFYATSKRRRCVCISASVTVLLQK